MKASVVTAYGGPAKAGGAHEIAGVQRYQLGLAQSIGADETIALDDAAAFAKIPHVDVAANTVCGKTGTDLLAKVRDGGTFATVTEEPDGAKITRRYASRRSSQSKTAGSLPASPMR